MCVQLRVQWQIYYILFLKESKKGLITWLIHVGSIIKTRVAQHMEKWPIMLLFSKHVYNLL